jgi:hypothetical protein
MIRRLRRIILHMVTIVSLVVYGNPDAAAQNALDSSMRAT